MWGKAEMSLFYSHKANIPKYLNQQVEVEQGRINVSHNAKSAESIFPRALILLLPNAAAVVHHCVADTVAKQ